MVRSHGAIIYRGRTSMLSFFILFLNTTSVRFCYILHCISHKVRLLLTGRAGYGSSRTSHLSKITRRLEEMASRRMDGFVHFVYSSAVQRAAHIYTHAGVHRPIASYLRAPTTLVQASNRRATDRAKWTKTRPACRSLRNRIIGWVGRSDQALQAFLCFY